MVHGRGARRGVRGPWGWNDEFIYARAGTSTTFTPHMEHMEHMEHGELRAHVAHEQHR